MNREPIQRASYFWLGTGGHFALEDYHGYNYYEHPVKAFRAYVIACKRARKELPDDWQEQAELGEAVLDYYLTWLENRDALKTYWVDGKPQVEVRARIPLPISGPNGEEIYYDITIDRVVNIEGELWIQDYKFYKQFWPMNLDFDEQMTAYLWGAHVLYDLPVIGALHTQFKKAVPEPPKILTSGKISTAKNQNTTHRLYREALIQQYGTVDRAPTEHINTLNHFAHLEGEERDNYIKRERTERSQAQLEASGDRILMEVREMLDPNLPIYPNFTKDCSWDCPFNDVCLMIERDDDWENYLMDISEDKTEERDSWRNYLPTLEEV